MDYGKKAPKTPENEDKKMAKMKALKELRGAMSKADGDGVSKAMSKKVTVAAPSTDKLKDGLKMAESMLPDDDNEETALPKPSHNEGNDYASEDEANTDMEDMVEYCETPEQIDEMIKRLQAKKESLK